MSETVLITGASGGLGRALAARLSGRNGVRLVLVTRDAAALEGAVDTDSLLVEADVSTREGAELALSACLEHFGAPPAGLAHCAGGVFIAPLHRTSVDQYRACLRSNLDTAFFTLGAYVQALRQARQPGSAVLVSSVAAQIGIANHEAIAAAKGAIEALVRSAAATYAASRIRVNGVAPGLMRSPATGSLFAREGAENQLGAQYPLGRYGSVEDAAAAIAFLLSHEADWITGQILPIDGGFTAVRPLLRA